MKFQDNHENKIEVKYRSNSENLFKTVKLYLISFFRPLFSFLYLLFLYISCFMLEYFWYLFLA